jgi:hypothetical protein
MRLTLNVSLLPRIEALMGHDHLTLSVRTPFRETWPDEADSSFWLSGTLCFDNLTGAD